MFDHVTIRVADRAASERFYDTVLVPLGIERTYRTGTFSEWRDFSLTAAERENPRTERVHVAFVAPSREQVDAFWEAGTGGGYADSGSPGPRPQYREDYYGAFLRDPDGNSVEACQHGGVRRGAALDHVWIRVADLAASRRFYETIAPFAGLRVGDEVGDRVELSGDGGSLSLVAGDPTRHLHVAFPSDDDDAIRDFHRVATEAGYASNGPPGERARYHPGYYAAYVFDPDGNNVELVNHHRR